MNLFRVILLEAGKIQVQWQKKDVAEPETYPQLTPFQDPLSPSDNHELRWYLEEYLCFPYGAERNRAQAVEEKMAFWGRSLFEQVFVKTDSDPDPRGYYQEAVRAGFDNCELCVTSADAAFLNVPWELLYDPTPGRGYLAPSLAGLYRFLPGRAVMAEREAPAGPFRMLLVVSRPFDRLKRLLRDLLEEELTFRLAATKQSQMTGANTPSKSYILTPHSVRQ